MSDKRIEEVPVVLNRWETDGTVVTVETMGWTTNVAELVITPKGGGFLLTHAPSGACIMNEPTGMPDLFRLADQLARFDWSDPGLYFSERPADWPERVAVVGDWYAALQVAEQEAARESDDAAVTIRC